MPSVPLVDGAGFRFRVSVVPARQRGDNDGPDGDGGVPADDGWELVRSGQTKDGISTLLVYRRPA